MMKSLLIQQQPVVEENMSNLTSASGEASVSPGNRAENENIYQQSSAATNPPPVKKKRNLPGNPDPHAEVIALSPKTLMATNRFLCEICNKGFQRDQNLQLHRRGHNLPWKLKQRTSKEVRKRVYICPEPSCVHHDPSRALGDLTGIKKHFCRKHGEKKWKCDKCSKRYAVQSDWKAHSKTCGTREYRCDCGTLFSRRDSFITHRAFCDALAEESAKVITPNPLNNPLQYPQANASFSHGPAATHINQQVQFPHLNNNFNSHDSHGLSLKRDPQLYHQQTQQHLKSEMPPWLSYPPVVGAGPGPPAQVPTSLCHLDLPSSIFSTRLDHEFSHSQAPMHHDNPPSFQPTASPHMSATALLQKAAQMGATMTKPSSSSSILGPHQGHMTTIATTTGFGLGLSSREEMESSFVHGLTAFGNKAAGLMDQTATSPAAAATPSLLHNMMNSLSSAAGLEESYEEAFGGLLGSKRKGSATESLAKTHQRNDEVGAGGGGHDGLTRDFLGLRAFSHRDILNMAAFDPCMNNPTSYEHTQNQKPWQG
ncbi:protein indeterminate-domain-containing protein [Cinnamomum micranthum f. kanehirae]|uniref:Protein indeterminate-domain-containing protein n=1 Tax=Cinnamomum micranthum f. kanehirae TaxID=337451 RepID=A0A443NHS2_9MAGN|nr:protein indeterminate-domain-containing protein [Cinnamomum micranthum f. kanehirae]